ncbi:MAG: sulfur carrier protein ThiS [Bacteroidota bacterium]|nr:sulfur carrier protein ThiS [Bacteroidota bacterium]MDP4231826.1 sulfur carrier protein ThiS [Bacteroidota bacterium]MDP4242712.1 sulfur carrier protein ThiS [Bacteroidota bacterium]MDP4287163.1 sulfur carrier protein ThiS [Bacteroidota bacterium]
MKLIVSGTEWEFESAVNVSALIERLALDQRSVAVAVNDEVVRRSTWPERELRDGDRVEIVRAVQGG